MRTMYQLANIFGLDINNKQHSIAIVDALNGINNKEEFVSYAREHKESIKYTSKTEKLDILSERFKGIELDERLAESYAKGDAYAVKLAKKVKGCMNTVEEIGCKWEHVELNGEKFFEDHELRALDEVGSVAVVIEYARTAKLVDEISKLYRKKLKQNERKALAGGTKKDVLKLAKSTVRSMD